MGLPGTTRTIHQLSLRARRKAEYLYVPLLSLPKSGDLFHGTKTSLIEHQTPYKLQKSQDLPPKRRVSRHSTFIGVSCPMKPSIPCIMSANVFVDTPTSQDHSFEARAKSFELAPRCNATCSWRGWESSAVTTPEALEFGPGPGVV